MRAVTEPYLPAAIDAALACAESVDVCAPANVVNLASGQADARDCSVNALGTPAAAFAHPVLAQLTHLEDLLGEWMTGNPDCQRALADLQRRDTQPVAALRASRETTVVPRASASGDYVSQLAAKLVRRSA